MQPRTATKQEHARSCWDEATDIIALNRNSARYVDLACSLLEAVPACWTAISAHVLIDAYKGETCRVVARCGSTVAADDECRRAVRTAIMRLAEDAIIPNGLVWVGVWIDYEVENDRLTATIRHGGRLSSRSASKTSRVSKSKSGYAILA